VAAILTVIHGVTVTHPPAPPARHPDRGLRLPRRAVALELRRLDRYVPRPPRALPANLVTLVGLPTLSVLLFWAFFIPTIHAH